MIYVLAVISGLGYGVGIAWFWFVYPDLMRKAVALGVRKAQIRQRLYRSLTVDWRLATYFKDNPYDDSTCHALIEQGVDILPFIFDEMRAGRSEHWAGILSAITGVNPVPEQDAGNIDRMTRAWLHWEALQC